MSRRIQTAFQAVTTEGGILPQALLERVRTGDKDLPGLDNASYHLGKNERIGEQVNHSWSRLMSAWKSFQEALNKLPQGDLAIGVTREKWLLPLFRALDYGWLKRAEMLESEGKQFAISHSDRNSPMHLMGWGMPIDKRTKGTPGAAKASPHGLVQEFLNRSDDHLWGFVSNGHVLRILRDNYSLTRQAYVEFDLERIMEGEYFAEFRLLWLVCHQSRVEADKPEECWLEKWFQQSKVHGVRALDKLRAGVEQAIATLGSGFMKHRENSSLHERLGSGELDAQDYYRQLLRLVYRLIFLFVAEDREALLDPDATDEAKGRYLRFYSTRVLRDLALRRRGGQRGDRWQALKLVMRGFGDGLPELGLPALGSFLWDEGALQDLMGAELANADLFGALRSLGTTKEGKQAVVVNWRNIGAEELGSIYESLLELHPELNKEAGTFKLGVVAGHERKTTGSYYTPTSLVDCLLDSALDPVLDEAAAKSDPAKAILALNVCDPACGSGHFLVAAARRIAKRLAAVLSGDEEPSPGEIQHALREVVGRCVFGVDLNPMAVELCKVSLWMEAIEPGRPLSFLASHILCGNALLGTTPALMSRGIPDDAFRPIEGDDRDAAKRLKKRNRLERARNEGVSPDLFSATVMNRVADLSAVANQAIGVEEAADDNITAVRDKASAWGRLSRSSEFKDAWFRADAWCAAFVWPKQGGKLVEAAITHDTWRGIEKDLSAAGQVARKTVRELAKDYRFFHWHLAFPQVFGFSKSRIEDDDTTGWTGGFDCVLGNPPWERLKLEEKEWFSGRSQEVVSAKSAAARRKIIAGLAVSDPVLFVEFRNAKRFSEGGSQFARISGRYPLMSTGDINTYALFVETNSSIRDRGNQAMVGCITPTGVATDRNTRAFFGTLLEQRSLVSFIDFENRKQIFPGVQGNMRFCLLTFGSRSVASFRIAAQLNEPKQMGENERFYELTREDVKRINPNTMNCPMFTNKRHAAINRRIYENLPVLFSEVEPDSNLWRIRYLRMFDLTNASHLFRTREQLVEQGMRLVGNLFCSDSESYLPLYEAKLAYQFNHRSSTYAGVAASVRFRTHAGTSKLDAVDLSDPTIVVEPRYWVPEVNVAERVGGTSWFLTRISQLGLYM